MTQPAGWYHDSQGAIRYWDGAAWTEHTQSAPEPQPAPPPPAPAATPVTGEPAAALPPPAPPTGGPQVTNNQQIVVIQRSQKSVLVAVLLAVLFGPVGLLYSSIIGGVILLFLSLVCIPVIAILSFGFGVWPFIVTVWVLSIIWAMIAATLSKVKAPIRITNG